VVEDEAQMPVVAAAEGTAGHGTAGHGTAGQGTVGQGTGPAAGAATVSGGAVAWGHFERAAPELAAEVRERFGVRKHCTMATLRRDGSPRISGTEVELSDGQLWTGSMPGAQKALDLRCDPRLAIHSPTVDPPPGDDSGWVGEAKVAGLAVEQEPREDGHRFRIDLTEVVLTRVEGDELVVTSWHPARGVQERRRR